MAGIKKIVRSFFGINRDGNPVEQSYILTGIPRSGTTLTCKLLSEQEQTVGLNEPIGFRHLQSKADGIERIHKALRNYRKSLLLNGSAPVRGKAGGITDNHFDKGADGKRKRVVERSIVKFDKNLKSEFKLFVKHNAVFTLLLKELSQDYPYFAIIRNPLALLGSWSTVSVPVSRGKMRYMALLAPDAQARVDKIDGLLDKQLFLLDYYFKAYNALPREQIFRYEDIIATNGAVLSGIMGAMYSPKTLLESKNEGTGYPRDHMLKCGEALLSNKAHHCWLFYMRSEVEALYRFYERQE